MIRISALPLADHVGLDDRLLVHQGGAADSLSQANPIARFCSPSAINRMTMPRQKILSVTAYSLSYEDFSTPTTLFMSSGSANTVSIPAGPYVLGSFISVIQSGTGTTTIVPVGVTIRTSRTLALSARYSQVFLLNTDLNEWLAFGDFV